MDIYTPLKKGELIQGTQDTRFQRAWDRARADSFTARGERPISSAIRHPITNPRFGQDQLRVCRVIFNLLPDLADEDAKIGDILAVGRPPDFFQNGAMCKDPAGIVGQEFEQFKFLRRQVNRRA